MQYLTKILLPEILNENTTKEIVMKKIGLTTKDELKSILVMIRQVQFSLQFLAAAMNDMKIDHFYNI